MRYILPIIFTISFIILTGCSSAYYGAMEKFGVHKRDLLVKRVESARNSQLDAKEEFQSALEQFASVVEFDGGELEDKYNRLNRSYENSKAKAEKVYDKIQSVESVAEALFEEWEDEAKAYQSTNLRRRSEAKLKATKNRYQKLISSMHRAESKIDPVLVALRDQVLFFKHNLNARAIASLQGELDSVETDIYKLIREMQTAIDEANSFIDAMKINQA